MPDSFDLSGNHLALDFANTVSERHTDRPVDRIPGYADLVAFAHQTGLIDSARAAALAERATDEPIAAAAAREAAVELREALYALFADVARGRSPAAADVARLDDEVGRLHIDSDLSWTWRDDVDALDDFIGAIVHAAIELATDPARRDRIRICQAPDCVWLFYDSSKNRSRRWCDMRQCGNRVKARRHYRASRER